MAARVLGFERGGGCGVGERGVGVRRLNRSGRGRLGVRARGGGGAEERVELGLELESDSGAGEEKGLTGGPRLSA
jgi:hypothetical protein